MTVSAVEKLLADMCPNAKFEVVAMSGDSIMIYCGDSQRSYLRGKRSERYRKNLTDWFRRVCC